MNEPKSIAIDDTRNRVWVPGAISVGWSTVDNVILRINSDPASADFNKVEGGWGGQVFARPISAAVTPDGKHAYVVGSGGSNVTVLDTQSNTIEGMVPVGIQPLWVAITPDGKEVWVGSRKPGGTTVIDTATNTVTGAIPGFEGPIAFTPNGDQAYVIDDYLVGNLGVVDTATKTVVKTLPIGFTANAVATSPDGRRAYASNVTFPSELPGTVKVIDTATNEIVDEIDVTPPGSFAYFPGALGVSPDGRRLYVPANVEAQPNIIAVIDTATDTVVSAIPDVACVSGMGPTCAATTFSITPDGKYAYLPQGGGVQTIDLDQGAVAGSISWSPEAIAPLGVAIVPNQGPAATLQASPAGRASASLSAGAVESTTGESTSFDATASSDSDGTVARYDWDFGDGATMSDAGPTPSHTYQTAGTYTTRVKVTDNEGCSTEFVYTGQTAYCTGSSAAIKSVEVTVADPAPAATDECEATLRSPMPSVSHWTAFQKKLRLRLKVEPGGYLLRSYKRGTFTLQSINTKLGKRMKLRRVDFALDGKPKKKDRKAPFSTTVEPAALPLGRHVFKATAYTKRGKTRTRTLDFQISDCEAAAFSASMIGKLPRSLADVELRARTGGPELNKATFTLPRTLRMKTRRLAGKKIGTIRLTTKSGTKAREPLRLPRRGSGVARLLSRRKADFDVRLKMRSAKRTVTVSGLKGKRVTGVSVLLNGRQARLFRNPRECRTHRFSATLISTSDQRLKLDRSLKMCKRSG